MKSLISQFLKNGKKVVLKLALKTCLVGLLSFSAFAATDKSSRENHFTSDDAPQTLTPNLEIEKEIRGTETHSFRIEAKAGDCVRLIVRQKGIDLVVSVKNFDGKIVTEVDRPNGSVGRETVTFAAEESGEFFVRISPISGYLLLNKYSILLAELSPPTEGDKLRIAAEKLTTEGESLRNDGGSDVAAKRLEQAFAKFQAALLIWEKLNDDYEQAVVQYGLGWTFIPQGKYDKATLSFARGLKTAQNLGDEYAQTLNYAGIGWSEFYLGNFEIAVFNFNLALESARKNDDKSQIARDLFGLGNIAYMRGRYDEAFVLLTECIQFRRETGEKRAEGLTNITLAKVLLRQKKSRQAIDYLNQSLVIFAQSPTKSGEGEAIVTLGWAYFSLGENQTAIDYFERVLKTRNNLGDKAGEAAALRGLSLAHTRAGDFQKAKAEVEKMFATLDSLRGESLNADTRLSFAASIQEYFEDGISILMQMHEREPNRGLDREAFALNERARSRTLLDLIQKKQTSFGQKANPNLLARKQEIEQQLLENLVAEREMRLTEKDLPNLKKHRLKIQDLLFSLRETEDEINRQSIGLGEIFAAQIVPLAEVQKILDGETILLEYALGTEQSYLWLVTHEKVFVFALPKREIIEKLVMEVRDSLILQKSDHLQGEHIFNQKAARLSEILLAPVLLHLKRQRLLIVPNGALQYIPFAALPKNAQPLLVDHEITYLPSASLLAFLQKKDKPLYAKEIAVFADPIFSADDERLGKFSLDKRNSEQTTQRLFSSRFEAEKIASFVSPDKSFVALDTEASREKIIKTNLSAFRILHFATHAFVDDRQPELSAVMLSNFDEKGRKINGLLRSSEIINLDLKSEMVVLSGCQTGLGKNVRGEGFLNLSRGFMLAGTSRLLVSLWEVEDKATAELMARFYRKHLKEKMPAAAALRAAKLEIMNDKRWRLPFYWSSFILQGDWK